MGVTTADQLVQQSPERPYARSNCKCKAHSYSSFVPKHPSVAALAPGLSWARMAGLASRSAARNARPCRHGTGRTRTSLAGWLRIPQGRLVSLLAPIGLSCFELRARIDTVCRDRRLEVNFDMRSTAPALRSRTGCNSRLVVTRGCEHPARVSPGVRISGLVSIAWRARDGRRENPAAHRGWSPFASSWRFRIDREHVYRVGAGR